MGSTTDFLWNGKAPSAVNTYGKSTANIPQFMSDYVQGLLGKSNQVAAEPWQSYGAPRIADFTQDQQNAFDLTRQNVGAWQPALGAGVNSLSNVASNGGNPLGYAAPWLNAAGNTWDNTSANNYMSPYIGNVVDRIGELAGRNLNENLLPGLRDDFVRAGQYGSARMGEMEGRALRDTQESALAQQNQALNQGYTNAQQAFQADQSRLGQVGQTYGNLASMGAQNMTQAGSALGNLANLGQTMDLRDAAALESIGAEQQNLNQQNLSMAYNDFLQQRDWPKTQLSFMNSMIQGLPYSTSTTAQSTAPLSGSTYQPSGLSQLVQAGSLYGALNGMG